MFPPPVPAKPIEVFVLVQVKLDPATLLENGILIGSPAQKLWFVTKATTGSGLMVILKVCAGPEHPFLLAVTVKLPTKGVPVVLTGAV